MQTQTQTSTNGDSTDIRLFIKMVRDAWDTNTNRFNKLLDTLTEEQLSAETAPGRNTGIYLVGHLIAVNDAMIPLLGLGERLHPELEKVFLGSPDKSGLPKPSLEELKKYRNEIDAKLSAGLDQLQPEEWFTKHASVSAEDFAKEPHRNKLNILINRSNHHSYHLGQLNYLVPKTE